MFVYPITSRLACSCYHPANICAEIKKFQHSCLTKYGIPFNLQIEYRYYQPAVNLVSLDYVPAVLADWLPELSFKVWGKTKGLYVEGLRLPGELQRKGIGTYCTDWLKGFCRKFSLNYIVLGSYPAAAGFWVKMGFTEISGQIYEKKYPVW